ncbi:hypothetical protein [Kitasatospora sp. NPDC047058]|uniref:hypothetical protein n=1 Tax=Kitasatospora sp. NPDC047058 TaxID=3155620 RepID=UPI0033D9E1A7
MTKRQTTASKRARALADQAQIRYADALRTVRANAAGLTVGMLLLECSTQPDYRGPCWPEGSGWDCRECEACAPPARFFSQLLGTPVPYDSVLQLVGALASGPHRAGLGDDLVIEELAPGHEVRVRAGGRRFEIGLSQGDVWELCAATGCGWHLEFNGQCRWHIAFDNARQALREVRSWAYGICEERLWSFGTEEHLIRAALAAEADEAELIRTIAEGVNLDVEDPGARPDEELQEILRSIAFEHERLGPVVRGQRRRLDREGLRGGPGTAQCRQNPTPG